MSNRDTNQHIPLEKILPYGKENAITRAELAKYYNISLRDMDKYIERTRKKGIPILAKKYGGGGLYLTHDIDEAKEYKGTLFKEIRSRIEIYRIIDNYIIETLQIQDGSIQEDIFKLIAEIEKDPLTKD